MDFSLQNKIVSFIWSIADDCLRDVYVRGKYRDVILPMFVLRRLDCLLESSKEAVMEEVRFQQEEAKFTTLDPIALCDTTGYVFYNTADWTLKKLVKTASNNRQILEANFQAYLDRFSDNVKEIISKFELRNQIKKMVEADVLLEVLEKFTSPDINLSPDEALDPQGRKLPGLSNLGMGYVFEELIRKFNEENNEEAGEHFTPREVIELMTHLLFIPVKEQLPPVITVYDGACGSGGMLTEAQDFILDSVGEIQYIIENDWLEAIVQLPNNLFYNTGITTYIWVLSNRKAAHRRGKVQLIDASEMYQKLRKNLGAKNCEFAPEQIEKITHLYLEMQPAAGVGGKGISKIFDNRDFGYYKVSIDRPLRLAAQFTADKLAQIRSGSAMETLIFKRI